MTYNPRQVTFPHGSSIYSPNQQDKSTNCIELMPPGLLRVPGQSEAGAAQLVSSGSLSQGYRVSSAQQSGSVTHTRVSVLFQILFPFRLLPNVEQSSLCYTVGPCWLSFLLLLF